MLFYIVSIFCGSGASGGPEVPVSSGQLPSAVANQRLVAASSLSFPHFPTKPIPGAPSGLGRPGVLSHSSGVVRGQRLGRPGPQRQPLLGQRGATGVLSCRGRGAAQLP